MLLSLPARRFEVRRKPPTGRFYVWDRREHRPCEFDEEAVITYLKQDAAEDAALDWERLYARRSADRVVR